MFARPEAVVAIVDNTTTASEIDHTSTVSLGSGGPGTVKVGGVITTVLDRVATKEIAATSEELGITDGARVCFGISMQEQKVLWNDESLPSMLDKFEAFPVALVLVAAFVLLVALLVDFLEEDVVVLWLVGKVVFFVPDVVTL